LKFLGPLRDQLVQVLKTVFNFVWSIHAANGWAAKAQAGFNRAVSFLGSFSGKS
jgi:hypothetical protein